MSTTQSRLSRCQSLRPEPSTQSVYHENSVLDVMPVVRFVVFFCYLAYIAFAVLDTGPDDQV